MNIIIDAGHGGHDSGAVGLRSFEKDLNLIGAKKLQVNLAKSGHNVHMTRIDDNFITLTDRTKNCNKDTDIFISIHHNSTNNKKVSGSETFYSIKLDDKQLANKISYDISQIMNVSNRGAKTKVSDNGNDYFTVINDAVKKGVKHVFLVEIDFISNEISEEKLINDTITQEIYESITNNLLMLSYKQKNTLSFNISGKNYELNGYIDDNGVSYVATRELLEVLKYSINYDSKNKIIEVN